MESWALCAVVVALGLAALGLVPASRVDASSEAEATRVLAVEGLLGSAPTGRARGAGLVTVHVTAEHPRWSGRGERARVGARVRVVDDVGRVRAVGRASQTRALPTAGPDRLVQSYDLALSPRDSRAVRRAAARPRTRVRVDATVDGARGTTTVQDALQALPTSGRRAYVADMGPQPQAPGLLWSIDTATGGLSQSTAPPGIVPNQVIVGLQGQLLVASSSGVFEAAEFAAPTWSQLIPPETGTCGNPQIALSADGRYVAMTSPGCVSMVQVYDLETDQLYTIDNPSHDIMWSVAFSGDGERVYAVYHAADLINWRLAQWSVSSIVSGNPARNTFDLGTAPHDMGPIAAFGNQMVMAESDNKLYVAPQDVSSQDQIEVVEFGSTVNVDPGWLSATPPQFDGEQYLYIGGDQPNLGCYDGQVVSSCTNPAAQPTGAAVMVPGSTTGAPGVPPATGLVIAGDVGGEGGEAIYQFGTSGAANTPIREYTGFFEAAGVGITPHASPTISNATPQVDDLTVDLDASQSYADDLSALTYSWDFGDGATGSGAQVSHTYAQPGTYQVTLTVDDGESCPAGVVSDGMNILCAGPSQVSQQLQVQATAPAFAASPDPVDFGNVWVNEDWIETVTVTNTGSGSLDIGQVTTSGAPFTLGDDSCSNQSVGPGSTCTLQVSFAPTAPQTYQGQLSFPTDVPGQATQTVDLSGTGIEPGFAVSPDPVAFGDVWANESRSQVVTVTNAGNGPLNVGQVVSSDAPFALSDDDCSNRALAPDGECTVRVAFAPTAAQGYQGELHFAFNTPDIKPKTVDLSGTGVEPGFAATPNPVAFGEVPVGEARSEQLTVTNTGNGPLEIAAVDSTGAPFTVSDDQCSNRSLAPNGSCTLQVDFAAGAAQEDAGQLTFSFDTPDITPKTVTLTGAGVEPGFLASPGRLALGDVVVGHTASAAVQVTNTGREALDIGELSTSGSGFSIAGGECAGAAIAPGAGCTTQIAFTPQALGPAQGELRFTTNVPGQPTQTVPLSGAGVSPIVPPASPTASLAITNAVDHRRGTVGRPLTYTVVVTNGGQATATEVEVTDTLSVPGRIVSVNSSAGVVASQHRAEACTRRLPLRCSVGAIQPGGTATLTIVVIPKDPGRVRNTATVTALGVGAGSAGTVDAVTVAVAKPVVRLTMGTNRRSVATGQTIEYSIDIGNPTALALRRVRTCTDLPAGLVYLSATRRATLSKGRRCWTTASLGARKTVTYRLTARALNGSGGSRTARVSATSPDTRTAHAKRTVNVTPDQGRGGGVTG